MMIGQEQLMRMELGGRDRRENKADGSGWKIIEFAFILWLAAVLVLCLLIVVRG